MTLVIHLVGIHSCLPCSKTVCWGNTGEFNTRVHMFSPTLTLTLTLLLTDNKHDTGSLQKLLTIHLQCEVALSFVYLNTLHHQLCMSRKTCFFFFFFQDNMIMERKGQEKWPVKSVIPDVPLYYQCTLQVARRNFSGWGKIKIYKKKKKLKLHFTVCCLLTALWSSPDMATI